jgi:hypothetical protein
VDYVFLFPIFLILLLAAGLYGAVLKRLSRHMGRYLEEAADFPEAWLPDDPGNYYWQGIHYKGLQDKKELDSEVRYQYKLYVFTGRPLKYMELALLCAAVILFCIFLVLTILDPLEVQRNMTLLFSAGIAAALFLLFAVLRAEYHDTVRMIKGYQRKRAYMRSIGRG